MGLDGLKWALGSGWGPGWATGGRVVTKNGGGGSWGQKKGPSGGARAREVVSQGVARKQQHPQ